MKLCQNVKLHQYSNKLLSTSNCLTLIFFMTLKGLNIHIIRRKSRLWYTLMKFDWSIVIFPSILIYYRIWNFINIATLLIPAIWSHWTLHGLAMWMHWWHEKIFYYVREYFFTSLEYVRENSCWHEQNLLKLFFPIHKTLLATHTHIHPVTK